MDFGLAFSYVFKDKDWFKKIAIPALVSLIPVIGQLIVVGWALKVTKNVIEGNEEHALPSLEFGADLGRGFMAFLILLIYSIPVIVISGIAALMFSLGGGFADQEVLMWVMFILGGCLGLLGLLLAILIAFLSYVGLTNYIAKGEFGAAFRFKELFGMLKKAFVSWLLVMLGQILAMGIIAPLGTIACGIGALLTFVYGNAIFAHMLGQAYNKASTPMMGEVETL